MLLQLLKACYKFETTEWVDSVYALRPLATDSHLFPRPDYDLDHEEVFVSYALTMIDQGYGSAILLAAGVSCRMDTVTDLPSWMPDWTLAARHFPTVNTRTFTNDLNINHKVEAVILEKDTLVLRASCMPIAQIAAVSSPGVQHYQGTGHNRALDVHKSWQQFAWTHDGNELIEVETFTFIQKILDKIKNASTADTSWKELSRDHIEKKTVRDFYLQLLFIPPTIFDLETPEGFDLSIEFLFGYNVRLVIGRNILCATGDGYIGLVPEHASKDNLVVMIDGLDELMVLSPYEEDRFMVIGDCCFVNIEPEVITDEDRQEGLLELALV